MKNRRIRRIIKKYLFEIITFIIAGVILLQLLFGDLARILVTNFTYLRPENAFILFIVFSILTFILILWIFMHARRKKLKSTRRMSPFAATLERSHKIREMSQTQVVYTMGVEMRTEKQPMPKDIDKTDTNIIEFYFNYEEKLNI